MDIIERAARALWAIQEPYVSWDDLCVNDREFVASEVRAVLGVFREPSKAMLDKGIDAADDVVDYTRDTDESYRCDSPSDMPLPIWRAMIDAALNPPAQLTQSLQEIVPSPHTL